MFFRLFLRNRYFRRILSKKLYFYKKFFQIKPNEDVNQKAFTNLSLTWEKQMDFLCLCETSNTLQLPVFLFFCQSCPGVWNWESVFLILKISQYGRWRQQIQLFLRYSCKNWCRNWYFHFDKTYDHQLWQTAKRSWPKWD